MKITKEYLRQIILEAFNEATHDTQADGIEAMQPNLREEEGKKGDGNNRRRKKRNKKRDERKR